MAKTESKEVPKATPFRLEEEVQFSSSDRYNDAYRCMITARKTRDRFTLSLVLNHEPSQNIVFTNYWIYTTRKTCESKFGDVVKVVTDTRDFIEAEGLKTVVAQYMLRHSLSAISSDIENIYQTAIPYIRQVVDKDTRGNIIKNIPTIPFRTQVGPDTLGQVYHSTGMAPNPVPEDDVQSPSIYQHVRKEKGIKDVIPSPVSDFQLAAGIRRSASASGKATKTGSLPASLTEGAVAKGKEAATSHYRKHTGASEEDASKFYEAVREICRQARIMVDLPSDALVSFLVGGPCLPQQEGYNLKQRRLQKVLGTEDRFSQGSLRIRPRTAGGNYALVMDPSDDVALFGGDLDKTWNSLRDDYQPEVSGTIYDGSSMADCKASSVICAMSSTDLAAGPNSLLERISDSDLGSCDVVILRPFGPDSVSEIVAPNEGDAVKVRKILEKIGKILPVSVAEKASEELGSAPEPELPRPSASQEHFSVSDRVAHKPRLNNPSFGTITDVSEGVVTVHWDEGKHEVYDVAEALMRLMTVSCPPPSIGGTVVYRLPGLEESAAKVLSSAGIDPVTIYSLASFAKPAFPLAGGWEGVLLRSLSSLGLNAKKVSGYVRKGEGKPAFSVCHWVEAKLPKGNRLVIEMTQSGPRIHAGRAKDYVVPKGDFSLTLE